MKVWDPWQWKKSKNVEIVFSIPKAKSESISIKIRQPLFWTDPYLPDLVCNDLDEISLATIDTCARDGGRSKKLGGGGH